MVTTPYFRGGCDDRVKGLAEPYVRSCLATLNTMNGAQYKTFLQEKLVGWFDHFPDVRAAPKAGRASLPGNDEEVGGEADEGEEGCIEGELPVL